MREDTFNWMRRIRRVLPAVAYGVLLTWIVCACAATAVHAQQPDPAGIATGDKTNAIDAGGNAFVVTEPTDKADPDYAAKKKAFDEYQAQAAKEPLAVKLADSVGHVRLATNFGWTLNTGYLVLFMQAGFALLTCGLVRKKNAAHLMMLNFAAYVFAFLAYWACGYAFQFGAVAINAAPADLGGTPTLNHFLLGSGQWGFLGGRGFFLSGPAYDAGSNVLTLFEVVFMETAGYIIVGSICERINFWAIPALRDVRGRDPVSDFRMLGVGWRLDVAARRHDEPRPRLRGLRRIDGRPRGGRLLRDGVGDRARPASRQVRSGRQAACFPGPQHRVRRYRDVHPAVRLDGLQPRLDAGGHRPPDWRDRDQHQSRRRGWRRDGDRSSGTSCSASRTSRWRVTACWRAWWPSPLRARSSDRTPPCSSASSRACIVCFGVLFNERVLKVDDPCGAISVHGYCGWFGAVAVGIFADGTYGAGWNGVGAATYLGKAGQGVTGLLHGDTRSSCVQLGGATLCAVYAFGLHVRRLQVRQRHSPDARQQGSRARGPGRARVRHAGVPGVRRRSWLQTQPI